MLVFIEAEFSIVLISLGHFQSENVVQIPVTLQGKTIFNMQATISLKNRRFDEKSATKSTTAGTHIEVH